MSSNFCILAGVTSTVISSEAWHIMAEASDIVSASSDSTRFTRFTSGEVCLPGAPWLASTSTFNCQAVTPPLAASNLVLDVGEPSFYFYVSNSCTEEGNAPPLYFDVKVSLYMNPAHSSYHLALFCYIYLTATATCYRSQSVDSEALQRRERDARKACWYCPGQELLTSGYGGLGRLSCVVLL